MSLGVVYLGQFEERRGRAVSPIVFIVTHTNTRACACARARTHTHRHTARLREALIFPLSWLTSCIGQPVSAGGAIEENTHAHTHHPSFPFLLRSRPISTKTARRPEPHLPPRRTEPEKPKPLHHRRHHLHRRAGASSRSSTCWRAACRPPGSTCGRWWSRTTARYRK